MPQLRNDQMAALLASEFQRTYDQSFGWESLCSAYLALPALRAFWPMSVFNESGNLIDIAQQHVMTNVNTAILAGVNPPVPHVGFDSASSQYFYASDTAWQRVSGTETYVYALERGLTIGGWVRRATGTTCTVIAKWGTSSSERSYILYTNSTNEPVFGVSGNGTNGYEVTCSVSGGVPASEWHFVAGVFAPYGTPTTYAWIDDNSNSRTDSIPSSLFAVSGDDLHIGAYNGGSLGYMNGLMSCIFLCASALSSSTIRRLYYRTRPAFQNRGVPIVV